MRSNANRCSLSTIADPDRSNPTRNRWERPLDTIRSFEAAIDGNYRRSSYYRPGETSLDKNYDFNPRAVGSLYHVDPNESAQQNSWNRRSSYYAGEPDPICLSFTVRHSLCSPCLDPATTAFEAADARDALYWPSDGRIHEHFCASFMHSAPRDVL